MCKSSVYKVDYREAAAPEKDMKIPTGVKNKRLTLNINSDQGKRTDFAQSFNG